MDELKFKYDVMRLTEDRCEVKRFKRKPFLIMLCDMFTVRTNFVFCFLLCLILFVALLLFLIGVPLKFHNTIAPFIVPFFFTLISYYYDQHKSINILTGDIKEIYVNKNGIIMKIKFMNSYGYMGVKAIDLPDNEHEIQYLINRLNEKNLFVTDKRHSKK
jgi:energy-coupling factor transporter transmembrane protein EcfT